MERPDLSRRASTPELMETEACSFPDYRDCLQDLARVNRLTLAARPTLAWLDTVLASIRWPRARPLAVVDIGCGYGDMLRRIDRWAARRGIAVALTGVDCDPRATRAAAEATRPDRPIRWITADFARFRMEGPIDVVLSGLFCHHLDDAALVRFLSWMEATAQRGWFVNDLHRHALPYYVFLAWARAARWHRFVRHDGPVSISRAFTVADWRRALADAGIPEGAARIAWRMPFRLCVSRVRAS